MVKAFFLVCDENPKVTEAPANLHKASKKIRDQACQLITVPPPVLSKQTFELRITLHKIKQINAPLSFTKIVYFCLFMVVDISSPFKRKSACTLTDKTTQLSIKTGKITSP